MGSFSFTRAEHTTQRANISWGDKYKILVPKEFGGGYIVDQYSDYGNIFEDNRVGKYVDAKGTIYPSFLFNINDLMGILSYWNNCPNLKPSSDSMPVTMLDILKYGDTCRIENRLGGIDLFNSGENYDNNVKYPLKLVSMSYKFSYEDCVGKSYNDPHQGFCKKKWSSFGYELILRKLKNYEARVTF
ncbi:hypothetical protein J6A31_06150 [bacterium]|nr:hypothetical protein [bacterium]